MKKRILLTVTGLLAIGLMFGANFAHARTADSLDPTFGTGGTITTTFTGDAIHRLVPWGRHYTSDESGLC